MLKGCKLYLYVFQFKVPNGKCTLNYGFKYLIITPNIGLRKVIGLHCQFYESYTK